MPKLSHDLVLIRKEMRLSKQNVFEKCRVPMETIDAIEDGSIFSGKTRNKTYLRSYFRTYAKAIGISNEDMIQALDEQESGRYSGSLSEKYLAHKKISTKDTDTADTSDKTPETDSKKETKGTPGTGPKDKTEEKPSVKKRITPESQEKTLEDIEWEDQSFKKPQSTSTSEFASSESREIDAPARDLPPPPDLNTVDWATKIKNAVYRPQRNRLYRVIIVIIFTLALASGAIYWYWQYEMMPVSISPPTQEVAPPQTGDPAVPEDAEISPVPEQPASGPAQDTDIAAETPAPPPSPEDVVSRVLEGAGVNDTLYVTVYALHGNLEPIRVYSDHFGTGDETTIALRPYWVEHQEAMRFEFVNEIIFQGTLSRMVLIFNGHVIDDFSNLFLDGSRISLTREFIMENQGLQVTNPSPFTQIPTPRDVMDRPRFSP